MRPGLAAPLRPETEPARGKWLFCIVFAAGLLALSAWPRALPWLRYDREMLAAGQAWRLLTAHLVHLNSAHLLLNLAGLVLICELLWMNLPLRHAAGLLLVSAASVSVLLWWLHPELEWYAGLSGALHGLWAGCAIAGWRSGAGTDASPAMTWKAHFLRRPAPSRIGAAGLLLLVLKLAGESWFGPSPAAAQAIGAPVVAAAHCYGAFAGIAYMLLRQGGGPTFRISIRMFVALRQRGAKRAAG